MELGKYFIYFCFTLVFPAARKRLIWGLLQGGQGPGTGSHPSSRASCGLLRLPCVSALTPSCSWQPSRAPKIHHPFPPCSRILLLPSGPASQISCLFSLLCVALRWRHTKHSLECHLKTKSELLSHLVKCSMKYKLSGSYTVGSHESGTSIHQLNSSDWSLRETGMRILTVLNIGKTENNSKEFKRNWCKPKISTWNVLNLEYLNIKSEVKRLNWDSFQQFKYFLKWW